MGGISNTSNVAYIGGLAIEIIITTIALRFHLIEMNGQEQTLVYLLTKRFKATRNFTSIDFLGEVDQIVQRRLANSPISEKSVHMEGHRDGSLRITVGEEINQDLIEVEDRDVRDLIQSAVDKWQNGNRS